MPTSLAFWVPVGVLLLCLAVLSLSTMVIYTGSRDASYSSHQSHANYLLMTLKRHVEVNLSSDRAEEIRHDLSVIGTVPEVISIVVADHTGRILFSNQFAEVGKSLQDIASLGSDKAIKAARSSNMPRLTFSADRTQLEAFQSFAMPSSTELRSTRLGIIYLHYNLALSEQALWRNIRFNLALMWICCGVLILVVMILLKKRVITPLGELARQASLLADGTYTHQKVESGFKEIATLTRTFNWAASAIREHITLLDNNQRELESRVKLRTAELQSANLNYEQAQKMARLGRWELELQSGLVHLSQEAYEILGASAAQPATVHTLFGHNDSASKAALQTMLDKQQQYHDFNYELYNNGVCRFIRLMAERYLDSNTGHYKLVGIVQDISEQMHKERSLIENQAMTRAIIDTAADAIIVINIHGEVQEFSPAAVDMFGYARDEVLGNNLRMLMPEPDRSNHDQYIQNYFDTGVKKVIGNKREVTARKKNGQCFPIDLAVAETKVGEVNYFTAIIRDITERKDTEKNLLEAIQAAQSATRAKSQFLANMSHEIRTPMHAITGLTHLALKMDASPKMHNYLKKIRYAADNLLVILNDILDISKIEAGKLSVESVPFRPKVLIEHICGLIAVRIEEKQLDFKVNLDSMLPQVLLGDSLRLSQILLNLLSNAVKFTPHYGSLSLQLAVKTLTESSAKIVFTVSDSGIGISQEQQQTLFTPFTQADASTTRQYGGTGLGLAISKNLVKLMDGRIWCESSQGKGTHFFVEIDFPIGELNAEPTPQIGTQIEQGALPEVLGGARVLLVEDNDINREIAQEILTDAGMQVLTAEHGKEALERLQETQVDLILMDCQMPVMDGYTATREIRKRSACREVPIIALTANVMQHDLQEIKACGMDDHIAKPINVELAYQKIYQWLSRKTTLRCHEAPVLSKPEPADTLSSMPISTQDKTESELLDIAQGLKHVNGNEAFYRKMSDKFIVAQEAFCTRLRERLQEEDIEEAARMAHTLKGQAGYLGLVRCAELAAQLEQAIEQQSPQQSNLILTLEEVLTRSSHLLRAAF
ncbi:PAS domain-containing hybrid sensor histidine kinase/response regulator [Pseudoalteromonas rubra]|uniref:PAS domain-containing hybrid sensor histidine kinase/response regulator n=1 Tax=Pseudoalteromonas rubra TaxID=43658 RepID=UPI001486A705|nr:PAS domain-containing hybrid sensor histidine kinase/response regulator [Pseudoalteromonas rubra]